MREFLGIDAALQRIKGEIVNHTSKITDIDRHIKREQGKLKKLIYLMRIRNQESRTV